MSNVVTMPLPHTIYDRIARTVRDVQIAHADFVVLLEDARTAREVDAVYKAEREMATLLDEHAIRAGQRLNLLMGRL